MMDWHGTWSADWSTVVAMCALMVLGWVALAIVVWLAVRTAGSSRRTPPTEPTRILDARLARGEVSEDEYLSARSLLGAHSPESEIQRSQRGRS